jgi:hypothetical protein
MPVGMFLRSSARASNISDARRAHSLEHFYTESERAVPKPVPLEDFVRYAHWFRERAVPQVDERRVEGIEHTNGRFMLRLSDGAEATAARVVVAAGIAPFANRPPAFGELSSDRVTHSVELRNPSRFSGMRVAVIGAGQSALESAALLHEAGSEVEVLSRASRIVWIPQHATERGFLDRQVHRLLYPPTEVGPRGLNWIAAAPDVFRRLPRPVQRTAAPACIRPMGAGWLRARLEPVPVTLGRSVRSAESVNGRVRLTLNDGSPRDVDHVVLGTGFRVDIARYGFLPSELLARLRIENGYPILSHGLETSIPGLHFVGAPAAAIFGPVMRFVTGTAFTSAALTRHVLGKPPLPITFAF